VNILGTSNLGVAFDYEIYLCLILLAETITKKYSYNFEHERLPLLTYEISYKKPNITQPQILEGIRELSLKFGRFLFYVDYENKDSLYKILQTLEHMKRRYSETTVQTAWRDLYHLIEIDLEVDD
jgi:hypothetical protein